MTKYVLTLIAPADKPNVTPQLVAKIKAQLAKEGGLVLKTEFLAESIACDIIFTRIEPDIAEEIARVTLAGLPIDCVVQEAANRQKKMLISDMDSTIITVECIDEIADFAGVKPQVAEITDRAMRGEIEFTHALAERVLLLKGLPESILQKVYDERVKFMPGAAELVATMRAHKAHTVLISGGFQFFTSRVRVALGFHFDASNTLETENAMLTGKVTPPILDKDAKLQALMTISSKQEISTDDVLAVGDGANDLPMLIAAGMGVAYHAKPLVQQSARARINHTDLTSLLYIQGYHAHEIVRPTPSSLIAENQ